VVVSAIRLYRDAVSRVLEERSGVHVADSVANVHEAAARTRRCAPGVFLVDSAVPDGLDLVRSLARDERSKVVVVGVAEEGGAVIPWVEAGAVGYVSTDDSFEELVAAIKAAATGEGRCSPKIVAAVLKRLADKAGTSPIPDPADGLTVREREIAGLVSQGLSNKEIASRLCLALPTVKNHVHSILEKLQVERRGQAAARLRPRAGPRVAPRAKTR